MPLVVNWASICANQTSGSAGQKGGSFTPTTARVGEGAGAGAGAWSSAIARKIARVNSVQKGFPIRSDGVTNVAFGHFFYITPKTYLPQDNEQLNN